MAWGCSGESLELFSSPGVGVVPLFLLVLDGFTGMLGDLLANAVLDGSAPTEGGAGLGGILGDETFLPLARLEDI